VFKTNLSKLEIIKKQSQEEREKFFNILTPEKSLALMHDLTFVGRPKQQLPEGDWDTLLVLAGRSFGKTYMGSHIVCKWAAEHPGCRIAMIAETSKDLHKVMIGGDSGVLKMVHPMFIPEYNKTDGTLLFPNGSIVESFNGTEPNQLRGPQFHYAWLDELAKYRYQDEIWDMLTMCMRLGDHPQVIITTTPRPTKLIKSLVLDPTTHTITGSSFENTSLPKKTVDKWKQKYEGTRLGRQELYAEILIDNPYGLFKQDNIDKNRIQSYDEPKVYDRIVIAVDPAITNNPNSDATGITVAARKDDHGYLLHDGTMNGTPNEWVQESISLYHKYNADVIVYENNQGGLMTENLIGNIDRNIRVIGVRAFKNKQSRAEPVSALYEQNRIHHVGRLSKLEDEICDFDPTLNQRSPNRLDALVYAFTELFNLNNTEPMIWQP